MVSQLGFSFPGTGQVEWASDAVNKLSKSHGQQVVTLVASLLQECLVRMQGCRLWVLLFVETLLLTHSRPMLLPLRCYMPATVSSPENKVSMIHPTERSRDPANTECGILPQCDMSCQGARPFPPCPSCPDH